MLGEHRVLAPMGARELDRDEPLAEHLPQCVEAAADERVVAEAESEHVAALTRPLRDGREVVG